MKKSQHEVIAEYLARTDGWVPSYDLEKVTLQGVWVGTRGSRSARDLASNTEIPSYLMNKVERKEGRELLPEGITQDFKGRPIERKYAYYRSLTPKTKVTWYVPELGKEITTYN